MRVRPWIRGPDPDPNPNWRLPWAFYQRCGRTLTLTLAFTRTASVTHITATTTTLIPPLSPPRSLSPHRTHRRFLLMVRCIVTLTLILSILSFDLNDFVLSRSLILYLILSDLWSQTF